MEVIEPLLTLSVLLLGIGLTAQTAIVQYFKQREYELVLERYLEGSVDLLAATLDEQIQNHKYNWSRALMIVKQLRDFGDRFDINNIDLSLREIECSKFNIVAQYRLSEIIGSQKLWSVYQMNLAFIQSSNTFITDDLFTMLKINEGKKIPERIRQEIVDTAVKELKKQNEESDKLFTILKHFHNISLLLERKKINFKEMKNLRNNKVIIEVNNELAEIFKDELEEHKDHITI